MAAEKALKAYIQENTHDVLGEEIRWVGKNLPGEVSRLSPDFIGYDANGNLVIVLDRQPLPQFYTSMTKDSIPALRGEVPMMRRPPMDSRAFVPYSSSSSS